MLRDNHSIKLLDEAVEAFSSLPGVGRKSALRLALHILNQPRESVDRFVKSISSLSKDIKYCPVCRMISDSGLCPFCGDKSRDSSIICVVESIRDVLSIENTSQYNGHYHILGGISLQWPPG